MRRGSLAFAAMAGLALPATVAAPEREASSGPRGAKPTATASATAGAVRRPRLLFRIANRRVVVRVVELPRGPLSAAFPRAREPLVFDPHWRAGFGFAGYRFSIRVHASPGASARDLEWAEISARTLGVSAVGRG